MHCLRPITKSTSFASAFIRCWLHHERDHCNPPRFHRDSAPCRSCFVSLYLPSMIGDSDSEPFNTLLNTKRSSWGVHLTQEDQSCQDLLDLNNHASAASCRPYHSGRYSMHPCGMEPPFDWGLWSSHHASQCHLVCASKSCGSNA